MPSSSLTRYSKQRFPPYRHVPGRSPHPTRDPAGHSFGAVAAPLSSFDPERWRSCAEYLYAIDLFNHAYWWEAHEALEAVWRAAGRRTATGMFLQGLIQVAAALLKRSVGARASAARLSATGCSKVRSASGVFLGIDADAFASEIEAYMDGRRTTPPSIRLVS